MNNSLDSSLDNSLNDSLDNAESNPESNPGNNPGSDTSTDTGSNFGNNPGNNPGSNSGNNPESNTGNNPGSDSGTDTRSNFGNNPGSNSGNNPGSDTGSNSGNNPGSNSGNNPESSNSRGKSRGKSGGKSLNLWGFLVPLVLQLAIVLAIPLQKAVTLATGTTVYLQTVPIDPYDLLRGRYVILNYEIAQRDLLETLPGWSDSFAEWGTELYVIVEPPTDRSDSSQPWQAVAVSANYPRNLQGEQQVIKGTWQDWLGLDLGLGAYYIPESIGDDLEADIRKNQEETRVEAKVDALGNTALVGLWVADRSY